MMSRVLLPAMMLGVMLMLTACASGPRHKDSIGSLSKQRIEVSEPIIDDALERAMNAYRQFLQETEADAAITPEAMRRLADLQLEAGSGGYDVVDQSPLLNPSTDAVGKSNVDSPIVAALQENAAVLGAIESEQAFEARVTRSAELSDAQPLTAIPGTDSERQALVNANTQQAIQLYQQLLEKYPYYQRNDQVMYQLARAYEENLQPEQAKLVLDTVAVNYPNSVHYDEVQFRRGELFFVRKQYKDAELAYAEVIKKGTQSAFYDQALFKRGWSLFKQSAYEWALDDFFVLLDLKTQAGYHIETETNKTEHQRVVDTFRVVSLSFSYLGGPDYIQEFFNARQRRDYEYLVYRYLGEHYLSKRRFQDAALAYTRFIDLNPLHAQAPRFHRRTIEIFRKGQFPKLVIDSKREFALTYDINSEFWTYHDIQRFPEVLAFIKTNLNDLAKHYHAISQRAKKRQQRQQAYQEAVQWYRRFLASFPDDAQAPELNFLLAELLFDNNTFQAAAEEYERTAYGYPLHPKAAESGYAAILAFREYEQQVAEHQRRDVHQQTIRSSLQFAATYPQHPQAPAVLTSAAENLYALQEYQRAIAAAETMVSEHAQADPALLTAAWIVIAHSQFDLQQYVAAEQAYTQVLQRLPRKDDRQPSITDKLAASVYKQGEQHQAAGELDAAVDDFLRIASLAPSSEIRQVAEFDAATALIELQDWSRSAKVLEDFRRHFPHSPRQFEITAKLAVVYSQSDEPAKAAAEYMRIAQTSDKPELSREALLKAGELYTEAEEYPAAIQAYQRFISKYPKPIEPALEARQQLAELYRYSNQQRAYLKTLKTIVAADRSAGAERNDRTRYLAANAALILAEPTLKLFKDAPLGEPFAKTLKAKRNKMQQALALYADLADYQIAEITAAATYQIADIYYEFSVDLLESERPDNLSAEELEQYDLILEEQAYPFEEKAISVHEKNIELLTTGVFNAWISKSLAQLAQLLPARYAKQEQGEKFVVAIY